MEQPQAGAALAFSPEVEARHCRIDAGAYEGIYVVGDVHGCITELRRLWERLDPSPDDLVVFVGDLVRKGPASAEVVEFVRARENALSVLGNNEVKLLEGAVDPAPFEPVLGALQSFPLVVSFDDAVVVHGGVDPRRPLSEHAPRDLLETRSIPPGNGYDGPFWFERYDGPGRIFFGHTVLERPYVDPAAVGLDTGCVYGGALTAYDYRHDEFVSVAAEQPYRRRPDEKFLDLS